MSTCVVDNTAYVVQGDIDDYDDWTLDGINDLSTVTSITATVRIGKGYGMQEDTLTVTIQDVANRVVRTEYGDATGWLHDAKVGTWMLLIHVLFNDGSSWTWPRRSDQADSPRIVVGAGPV